MNGSGALIRIVATSMVLMFATQIVPATAASATGNSIRQACTDLVLDYAYYRDLLDADATAAVFTEDATLNVLGQTYKGREAIRARIVQAKKAEGGVIIRHLMSTIRIFADNPDEVTGVSYVTVYSAPGTNIPVEVEGFAAIGEYHDRFVHTAAGWKIAERNFVPVFSLSDTP